MSHLIKQQKNNYGQQYESHVFEQYKLYVEMADRISARRMLANSFFLGAHTALVTVFTILLKNDGPSHNFLIVIPFIAAIIICYVWWQILNSYRQLNSGKYAVVHELEQLLPVAPYDAEWLVLGEGKDRKKYLPLTHIEKWIPVCFVLLYVSLISMSFC